MSVLADVYLSSGDEDAARYDKQPASFADRLQLTSLTNLELSTLWAIMRNSEWDVDLLDQFPCILQVDGGQRTIHRLPSAMLSDLVGLAAQDLSVIVSKWAATDEMACEPKDASPVVDGLIRMARRASETEKSAYLWNCV
jgi:hypothetical protein